MESLMERGFDPQQVLHGVVGWEGKKTCKLGSVWMEAEQEEGAGDPGVW